MNVSSVTNHFLTANKGFITTLGGSILSGATTIPLTSVSGLTNGTIFVGIIEPGLPNEQEFTGTVDTAGVQITGVKWTDGTNVDHTAGVTIVDYVAATGQNMLTKGLLVAHDQDGTLKAGAVDNAGVIANSIITNDQMATAVKPETNFTETTFDFVASGCVWTADAAGSTLLASMTAGVVYISGRRVAVSAVNNRAFTASKDTYVDVGIDGVVDYATETNNAASTALAASHLRLGIIVSGASSIANAAAINQGQEDRVLPIASSIPYAVTDSLGNLICPRDPNRKILGYRQVVANQSGISAADLTGLNTTVLVPTGRKIKISAYTTFIDATTTTYRELTIKEGSTVLATADMPNTSTNGVPNTINASYVTTPSAGSHTYKLAAATYSSSATLTASTTNPCFILVELV